MRKTLYILVLFLAASCSKINPGDCFKNSGATTTESRDITEFRYLHMQDNVDVYITYSQDYAIEVRAGKNIIGGIKTEVSGQRLSIRNDNSCNWVRSYDRPLEVHVKTPVLDSIVYMASGNLTFTNQFRSDSIKLDVLEGAGSISLWLDMQRSKFNLHYGTVDLNVKGYSNVSFLYSGGYGPANLRNLSTAFSFLTSNSTNNCYIRASLELEATIQNVGDVHYWGDPATLSLDRSGSGNFIKRN